VKAKVWRINSLVIFGEKEILELAGKEGEDLQ